MKRIFIFLISLFVISLVSAEVNVTFNLFNATIESGNQINGNSPVSDFQVIGYTCSNIDCTNIGAEVNSLSGHSTSSLIKLSFPTNLISPYGYLLYFYKDGYIGYEEYGITYSGNGDIPYPRPIYLSKKQYGLAEISDVSGVLTNVTNSTTMNLAYKINADGSSLDAILDLRHSDVNLKEDIQTNSWFVIRNSSNKIIHQEKESNNLEYSGTLTKSFDYPFNQEGIYNVTIISEITDDKVIEPTNSSYSFLINVYLNLSNITNPNNQTNETNNNQTNQTENNQTNISESFYTISNITLFYYSNFSSNYSFNLEQETKKINQSGEFNVSSNLTIKIFNSTNDILNNLNYILDETQNYFDFSYVFNTSGNYTVNALVCPLVIENSTCSEKNISFEFLKEDDSDDQDDNKKSSSHCRSTNYVSDGYEEISSTNFNYPNDESNNSIFLKFNNPSPKNNSECVYYFILSSLIFSFILVFLIILVLIKKHL